MSYNRLEHLLRIVFGACLLFQQVRGSAQDKQADPIAIILYGVTEHEAEVEIQNKTEKTINLLRKWDCDFGLISIQFENDQGVKVLETDTFRLWTATVGDMEKLPPWGALRKVIRYEGVVPGKYWATVKYKATAQSRFLSDWHDPETANKYPRSSVTLMTEELLHGVYKSDRRQMAIEESAAIAPLKKPSGPLVVSVGHANESQVMIELENVSESVLHVLDRWDERSGVFSVCIENNVGEVLVRAKQMKDWVAEPKEFEQLLPKTAIRRPLALDKRLDPGTYHVVAQYCVDSKSPFIAPWYTSKYENEKRNAHVKFMQSAIWRGSVQSIRTQVIVGAASDKRDGNDSRP